MCDELRDVAGEDDHKARGGDPTHLTTSTRQTDQFAFFPALCCTEVAPRIMLTMHPQRVEINPPGRLLV